MPLLPSQYPQVKADILANPDLNVFPNNTDGAFEIAKLYNLLANPGYIVWKTSVSIMEVGQAILNSDIANLTTANTNRLQTIGQYSGGVFNPSRLDTRAGFEDIFSVASASGTRAALDSLWRRSATRLEKLLASGSGTTASPSNLTFEGAVSYIEIFSARNS